MKRILLIGNAPLPQEHAKTSPAAGLRTYQFLQPLLEFCDVRLVSIAMPECYETEPNRAISKHSERYTRLNISKNDPELLAEIQKVHDEFHPDLIVSVNSWPSYIATGLTTLAPIWADLNGWIMAEGQAQAYKMDSNDYLSHYSEIEMAVLSRADKISTVSKAQQYAVFGELAGIGRLNKESFGYKFVEHIANGQEWHEEIINDVESKTESDIRTALGTIPKDAFVLLWLGGYNTWVDEFTLFKGVIEAMEKNEKIYFLSTGGGIKGLDNGTFARFQKMIAESEYKGRFIFLGWIDSSEIPLLYSRAQVGLNIDRRCIETATGARNRINEMMKFGLPVITTLGSEISYEVVVAAAGLGVKSGDHKALTTAILEMSGAKSEQGGQDSHADGRDRSKTDHVTEKLRTFGQNGQKYIKEFCNYKTTLKPLLDWLENPRPAPDRNVRVDLSGDGGLSSSMRRGTQNLRLFYRYLRENGLKKSFQKFLQKIRR